ncbi:MAG: ATP-binding protein [Candidatus Peribacteria bacterium]|jgi:hypothetical protein|nr:ATP-binding protein [Candidatus Peribacteria bacterium]
MNILIGANGSGKSNFIEIINQFTRTLILDYTFDKTILEQQLTKKYPEAIQLLLKKTSRLNKNINTQDLPAQIEIKLELFDNDFENIGFVCKYTDKINTIIKKYSSIKYRFPQYTIEKVQEQCKNLTMYAEFSEKEQTFIINQNLLSPIEFFALICIQEQELLHICIKIFNDFEKKAEERFWYPLKNTFSIISSKRTLNKRNFLSDFHEFDSYIFQEKKDDEQNLDGFYRTIHKIWSIINKNSQEILLREKEIEGNIEERLYNSVFWKTLSKNIKRFINKNIFIDYIQGGISIRFSNENGDIYALEDLSDGEQSILIILFSIHGNDLKN